MPELPEVETTRRGIEPHLRDRQVRKLVVRQAGLRAPPDASAVCATPIRETRTGQRSTFYCPRCQR